MDTNNNERGEGVENVGGVKDHEDVSTASFLKEKRGFGLEYIREYVLGGEGKRIGIIAGVILLAFVVLGVLSAGSLPGQPLYAVKTGVFENAGGLFRWTKEAQAGYQIGLMEARLSELKKLAAAGDVNESVQNALQDEVTKNTGRFVSLTEASEERTLDREAVMSLKNKFASVAGAMENISESNDSMTAFAEVVADIRRETLRSLRDEVEVYVSLTDDETLRELFTREFSMINEEVGSGELSEDTQARIGRIVDDIAEAIAADDATDALEGVYEARRLVKIENYLK